MAELQKIDKRYASFILGKDYQKEGVMDKLLLALNGYATVVFVLLTVLAAHSGLQGNYATTHSTGVAIASGSLGGVLGGLSDVLLIATGCGAICGALPVVMSNFAARSVLPAVTAGVLAGSIAGTVAVRNGIDSGEMFSWIVFCAFLFVVEWMSDIISKKFHP